MSFRARSVDYCTARRIKKSNEMKWKKEENMKLKSVPSPSRIKTVLQQLQQQNLKMRSKNVGHNLELFSQFWAQTHLYWIGLFQLPVFKLISIRSTEELPKKSIPWKNRCPYLHIIPKYYLCYVIWQTIRFYPNHKLVINR